MKRVGLFLGVEPNAGGMFQYALSLLEALRLVSAEGCCIEVAYVGRGWESILSCFPFCVTRMRGGRLGLRIADTIMALRMPGYFSRLVSSLINPIGFQLERLACEVWIFPAQDALAYQIRQPVLATVHDLMHRYEPDFPEVSQHGRYGIREHRFRNLTEWAKGVLVDSEIGKQQVVESYGTESENVHVLPYIPPRYIHDANEPKDFAEKYKIPQKFLFYPAQFWAHKNHIKLISAAHLISSKCPDLHFVFTGGQNHGYRKIIEHARSIGFADRISFTGFVPDSYLSAFYRRARGMIMPTFFGPTNIPPLEAFSCGCPVATSNIYGMPEQAKGAALLFDPKSVSQIANAIENLWNDDILCANLAKRGYEATKCWGQKEFSERLRSILHIYEERNSRQRKSVRAT